MSTHDTTTTDKFALALVATGALFLVVAVRTPFMLGLVVGAIAAGAYGHRTKQADLVKAASFTTPLYMLGWLCDWWISQLTPRTIDAQLLAIDHGVGVAVWHWSAAHPAVMWVLTPVYYGLGFAMLAGIAVTDRRREMLRAFVIAAVLGLLCYWMFPAVGPRWVGMPGAVRNCMPSLHLTWALLLWRYAPRGNVWRWPFALFAALTALATLATGEHYGVDLLVAVTFTETVCALAAIRIPLGGFLTSFKLAVLP